MQSLVIEAQTRNILGKKGSSDLRRQDMIPCVLYGTENKHFSASKKDFRHLIYTPDFKLAEIKLEGKTYTAIVKEVQFHPTTDAIIHIDFLELRANTEFKVEVPLRFTGSSEGVKKGGKLIEKIRKIKIKTTPEKLVDHLSIDISSLDLGKSVRVRDLPLPDGVEVLNAPAIPVATIEIPRALRQQADK